jgi:hypothetical protein
MSRSQGTQKILLFKEINYDLTSKGNKNVKASVKGKFSSFFLIVNNYKGALQEHECFFSFVCDRFHEFWKSFLNFLKKIISLLKILDFIKISTIFIKIFIK